MGKLIIIRHGLSQWNVENKFTGWVDAPLIPEGEVQAVEAGRFLKEKGYHIDIAFTSFLQRAIKTLWLCLEGMEQMYTPVIKSWRINERHYGDLQGKNKAMIGEEFGEEQLQIWRRSYDIAPPKISEEAHEALKNRAPYHGLADEEVPYSESLKNTAERFLPYYRSVIEPELKAGKTVLLSAHGNSIRALLQVLDGLSNEEIVKVNVDHCAPIIYEIDADGKVLSKEMFALHPTH